MCKVVTVWKYITCRKEIITIGSDLRVNFMCRKFTRNNLCANWVLKKLLKNLINLDIPLSVPTIEKRKFFLSISNHETPYIWDALETTLNYVEYFIYIIFIIFRQIHFEFFCLSYNVWWKVYTKFIYTLFLYISFYFDCVSFQVSLN